MILSGSVTIYTSEKGIKRTERYWLASALAEGVTIQTAGWTTEVQTATAEKPYLWTYEKVVYTDDSYEVFGPVVNSVRGAQGWKGALPRIGKWESGGTYFQGGEGEEFYDIKLYNGKYYLCKGTHTGHTTTPDLDTGWWIEATNEWKFIATDLIKADKGVVENLNANYITMTDENDNIIFCAKDGEVTCNTGTFQNIKVENAKLSDVLISGSSRSPFTQQDASFSKDYSDNSVYVNTTSGSELIMSLPWDVSQNGRRITLVNHDWGGSATAGSVGITAATGKYFYEDGVKKSKLMLYGHEFAELLGFGSESTFYGWIVIQHNFIGTTYGYGRDVRVLAFGKVDTGSTGSVTMLRNNTFDGQSVYVTRNPDGSDSLTHTTETAVYYLWLPKAWFNELDGIHCLLQAWGTSRSSSNNYPTDAYVYAITSATYKLSSTTSAAMWRIEIRTANNAGAKCDTGFFYEVKNSRSWN